MTTPRKPSPAFRDHALEAGTVNHRGATLSHHKEQGERPGFAPFSEALWADPAIRNACLSLQDEAGADVNLALLALFLAGGGRAADADVSARAQAASEDWTRPVTDRLRAARRALKGRDAALYARTLGLELEAERALQAALETIAADAPAARMRGAGLAAANLAALVGTAADSAAGRALLAAWGDGSARRGGGIESDGVRSS